MYFDANNDGVFNGVDVYQPAMSVELYIDANNNNVAESGELVSTVLSDKTGSYSFTSVSGKAIIKVKSASLGEGTAARNQIVVPSSTSNTAANLFIIGQSGICYAVADTGDDLIAFNRFSGDVSVIRTVISTNNLIEALTSNYYATCLYAIDGRIFSKYDYSTGDRLDANGSLAGFQSGVTWGTIQYTTAAGGTASYAISDCDGIAVAGPNEIWVTEVGVGGILFKVDTNGQIYPNTFGTGIAGKEIVLPAAISTCGQVDDIAFNPFSGKLYGIFNACSGTTEYIGEIPTTGANAAVVTNYNTAGVKLGSTFWTDIEGLSFTSAGFMSGTTGANANPSSQNEHYLAFDETTIQLTGVQQINYSAGGDIESCDCITQKSNPFLQVSVSGTIYNDGNGLTDNTVNGTGTATAGGQTLYAYLTDATGSIVQKQALGTGGTYQFDRLNSNYAYSVVISTTNKALRTSAPTTANLPGTNAPNGETFGTNNAAGSGNESGTPNMKINVTTGTSNITGVNFGFAAVNRITGIVWLDADGQNDVDANETIRAENVKINLYIDANNDGNIDAGSSPTTFALTNASGYYEFSRLWTSGTESYIMVVDTATLPAGQLLTATNKQVASFTANGQIDSNNNFGYKGNPNFVGIEGTVWNDTDENGSIGTGELGRAGSVKIKVYTDVNTNGTIDGNEPFTWVETTTDENGEYVVFMPFTSAVTYLLSVDESSLSGKLTTTNPVAASFTAGATVVTGKNFGYNANATKKYISGSVFNDVNQDTLFNNSDQGKSGVVVELYVDANDNGVIDGTESTSKVTTTTDANGFYSFNVAESCVTETLYKRVNADSDDARERIGGGDDGKVEDDKDELKLTYDGKYYDAVRFNGITIPQSSKILNAYIQFTAKEDGEDNGSLLIKGFNTANLTTFIDGTDYNISSRSTTSSSASWNTVKANWTKDNAGASERTTNISTIVQEIVALSGWNTGNSLGFVISGATGKTEAYTYDKSTSKAPLLYVQYQYNCNDNFIIKTDQTTLPTGYIMSTDNLERASFTGVGQTDINNNFGYKFPGSVKGNAFNDNTGLLDNKVNGTVINTPDGGLLYASLVNNSGKVVYSKAIESDGTYEFTNVQGATYSVVLSTSVGTIGLNAPAASLPANWANTGEYLGSPATNGNDGTVNGTLTNVVVTTTEVANANFAINKRPESAISLVSNVLDRGGYSFYTVAATNFKTSTGTSGNPNTEDDGTVDYIKLTSFPTNTNALSVNGVTYLNGGTCPITLSCTAWTGTLNIPATNGTPNHTIKIDPIDSKVLSSIPFAAVDNAGLQDATPGKVDIGFVFNSTLAIDDDNATYKNTAVSGNVTTNDFDPEGDVQTFGSFLKQNGNGSVITTGATVSGKDKEGNAVSNAGTLAFASNGTYTYTPATEFVGEIKVPYVTCDNGLPNRCDTALLVINVKEKQDPTSSTSNGIYANDDDAVSYGNAVSSKALINDGDPENDTITISTYKYDTNGDGSLDGTGTLDSSITVGGIDGDGNRVANAGTLLLDSLGNYTFTPTSGFTGKVKVQYTLCDDNANQACTEAFININVYADNGAANDPPLAGDDFATTGMNVKKRASWIGNDGDYNGDSIRINGVAISIDPANPSGNGTTVIDSLTTTEGGKVKFFANGEYEYTPPTGYIGPDQVVYEICDVTAVAPQPLCDKATIYFVVNPLVRDYGDLPNNIYADAWNVFVDEDDNGIPEGATPIWLGSYVSNEGDTRDSGNATANTDSDDGLILPSTIDTVNQNIFKVIVNSSVSNTKVYFKMYIDWDQNGTFDSTYVGFGTTNSPDTVPVAVMAPSGEDGQFYLRLRVSLDSGLITPSGGANNGETEDYMGAITPVPVTLIYFNAEQEGRNSLLTWQTASEENNDRFEIERRSEDGSWEKLDEVKGAGNSQEILNYRWTDYNPLLGVNYYRLRQVDFDGKFEYSELRAVSFDGGTRVLVYPNPANTSVNVVIAGDRQRDVEVSVTDVFGKEVLIKHLISNSYSSNSLIKLDLTGLRHGYYFVRVTSGTESNVSRILVQQ